AMGNTYWTPPADFPKIKKFALRIMLPTPQYSGNFAIENPAATPSAPATTDSPKPTSAGSILTPVLSGAAAIAASVAMMYL
ncbi:hypothetical protein BG000_010758, partial [Podila horticola]